MAGPIRISIIANSAQAVAAMARTAGAAEGMGRKVSAVGRGLTHAVTLPVLAIGAAAVTMSTDFNSAMTKIQTQAGGSAKDVRKLSAEVLKLGEHSQQGPEALAESLFHLKSVGLDNVKAMKALRSSVDLANVGGASLEDTTNALAGAWRSGIKGAHNFHDAVGVLNAIVGAGNMHLEDLTSAMSTGFLPSARSFGISLQSVGSALALMTDEGIPAQVAATRLRMSFSLLGAPSMKAAGLLSTIGLASDSLAKKMRSGGIVAAIGTLKHHLNGLGKTAQATLISEAFGGGRSSSAILTLLNNYNVLVRKQKQIEDTSGRITKAIATQAKTPAAQFHLLLASLETLAIRLGNVLLPAVTRATQKMTNALEWFDKRPNLFKKIALSVVGGLAILGPVLSIGGKLATLAKIGSGGKLGRTGSALSVQRVFVVNMPPGGLGGGGVPGKGGAPILGAPAVEAAGATTLAGIAAAAAIALPFTALMLEVNAKTPPISSQFAKDPAIARGGPKAIAWAAAHGDPNAIAWLQMQANPVPKNPSLPTGGRAGGTPLAQAGPELVATSTKIDAIKAQLAKASNAADIAGHSMSRNFALVGQGVDALAAKLAALKNPKLTATLNAENVVREMERLQAFRFHDKLITINERERAVGPGGGIGHPMIPAGPGSGSGNGASGGSDTHHHFTTNNITIVAPSVGDPVSIGEQVAYYLGEFQAAG